MPNTTKPRRNSLLTKAQPKLIKGEQLGYLSTGVHLAPSNVSGFQTCASASVGCRTACLFTAGHGQFLSTQAARIAKTLRFFNDRKGFMADLVIDVQKHIRASYRKGMLPAFRLNLTSDIRWEFIPVTVAGGWFPNIFTAFPSVQFYDYTAHANRWDRGPLPANYHLTFSRKESTADSVCVDMLSRGINVAIVFDVPMGEPLPTHYMGFPVIDGRETDLRFLDPEGVWVGLSALGKAKADQSGFVVTVS